MTRPCIKCGKPIDSGSRCKNCQVRTGQALGRHWENLKDKAMRRAGRCCEEQDCNQTLGLEVHHIVALKNGGSNDLRNLKVLCHTHHRQRHA